MRMNLSKIQDKALLNKVSLGSTSNSLSGFSSVYEFLNGSPTVIVFWKSAIGFKEAL